MDYILEKRKIIEKNINNENIKNIRRFLSKYETGKFILHIRTPFKYVDKISQFVLSDYNGNGIMDLFCFKNEKEKTEVHVLNGENNFKSFLFEHITRLHDFDNSFEISEYKFDYRFSLVKRFGYSCGAIFRNSILKEHNIRFYEDCSYMEDNLFNNEYFKYINNACYVSSATYCYIMYTGSLSHSKDKMTIINNTKNTADLFETKIDLNNLLNDKRECSEFLKFRRYFINSIFGDSINSEYGIEAASQKYVYLRREYIKLIKNSDLSISTKIFELFMQSKNIEKSVYKMLIKKKKIDLKN